MNDTFLPGSGFDTYESQDKVLMQLDGSTEAAVAARILQQQGFAVGGAVVRLAPEQAEAAQRAQQAAEALGIECILLNAEALTQQPEAAGAWPQFAALLTAADKLGIQYIGSSSRARLEVGTDGVHTVLPPVDAARDGRTALAALPQEPLARLLLPLGEFAAGALAELAQELQSVHIGKAKVENDEIGAVRGDHRDRLGACLRHKNVKAVCGENRRNKVADVLFVLDNEDLILQFHC